MAVAAVMGSCDEPGPNRLDETLPALLNKTAPIPTDSQDRWYETAAQQSPHQNRTLCCKPTAVLAYNFPTLSYIIMLYYAIPTKTILCLASASQPPQCVRLLLTRLTAASPLNRQAFSSMDVLSPFILNAIDGSNGFAPN